MKNKMKKISLITLMLIMLIQITVFADTLNIDLTANKENVRVGNKVKITVSWDEGMQAADFYLKYDSDKLEFIKSDLDDDYINSEDGQVKTAWFSMNDTDKTKIEYTFKAKKSGTAEFKTQVNGGFATGTLSMPTGYNEGSIQLEIKKANPIINAIKIIVFIIIILFILAFIVRKINNNQKGRITKKVKFK